MSILIVIGISVAVGIIAGLLLHKRVVKEDLKLAETVKKIVGEKIAVSEAIDKAKKAAEDKAVKAEDKKPDEKK